MPNTIITVRAERSDLDELASLFDAYRVFYKQESDLENAKVFLKERMDNNESIIFVSKSSGTLTGFTQLYPTFSSVNLQRTWVLNDLFVAESSRGKGISKVLIQAAKDFVITQKGRGLALETDKGNFVGNNLYPVVGFELDEDHNYYFWASGQKPELTYHEPRPEIE